MSSEILPAGSPGELMPCHLFRPSGPARGALAAMAFALTTLPASAMELDRAALMTSGAAGKGTSKVNLTEERQRKQNRISIAALPRDFATKQVKADGERRLVVFSDPPVRNSSGRPSRK